MRKKKIAEAKLKEELRERFHQIPAAKQKQFINRVYHDKLEEQKELALAAAARAPVGPEERAMVKGLRYIDIEDDHERTAPVSDGSGRERVRRAAEMRARRVRMS
ncbi:MAG: hypothetical protein HC902_05000, partial [Calothrix sp. SM1_5_4]|nr:hypothetical protein [Calothrix sp. SM1_5_4]